MAAKPKYEVTTWDSEKQKWTPQQGVRCGPYTLWGLKRALRKLQAIGYPCNYRSHDGDGDTSAAALREGLEKLFIGAQVQLVQGPVEVAEAKPAAAAARLEKAARAMAKALDEWPGHPEGDYLHGWPLNQLKDALAAIAEERKL